MQKKRFDFVDIAKGLGILAIIWGHIMKFGVTNIFVYTFHIPLFFFISGAMFRKEKYKSFLDFAKRRVKTLVIPYFAFSFLTWLLWVGYVAFTHSKVESYFMPLLQTFIAQGSFGYLVHNVPLWFVSCLLVIETLYFFIRKTQKDGTVIILCCVLALCSILMEALNGFFDYRKLPWSIGAASAGIVFYAAGNLAMQYGLIDVVRRKCKVAPIVMGVLLALTILLLWLSLENGYVSMGHEQYGNSRILFYINGMIGITYVFIFSMLIEGKCNHAPLSLVKWIGLNSVYFLFLENPIKGIVETVVSRAIHINSDELSTRMVPCIIVFAISTMLTIITVKCVLCVRNLFGKKVKPEGYDAWAYGLPLKKIVADEEDNS